MTPSPLREPSEVMSRCPTCGQDGQTTATAFDHNCPAAWAHKFLYADARTNAERERDAKIVSTLSTTQGPGVHEVVAFYDMAGRSPKETETTIAAPDGWGEQESSIYIPPKCATCGKLTPEGSIHTCDMVTLSHAEYVSLCQWAARGRAASGGETAE